MTFTAAQTRQLLRPINESRVLADGKGHSHVSQQDVVAHLIRVFGFGSFDIDVIHVECVFETERADKQGVATGRWDACYRALVRLTVRDPQGRDVCRYEDGSTATAQNQTRGDAHDLAYKSAISLSKKRAAINLGDQFGLSLYNRGQLEALVKGTLVTPDDEQPAEDRDMQDGVPRQVTLGNDEVERDMDAGLPRNKNGSISRSRVTDAQLAAAGAMTGEEKKAHNALVRSGEPDPADIERLDAIDPDDQWATGGEQA